MIRWILVAALTAAVLLSACGDNDDSSDSDNVVTDATGSASTDGANGPSPAPASETPVPDVCEPNPAPGTPETIVIEAPAPLTKHRGTVTVSGQIAAFEAAFKVRIFDATGGVISGATGMAAEGQVLSPFSQVVPAAVAEEEPACIWVYEESAQDGTPTNVAQIPVVIQP